MLRSSRSGKFPRDVFVEVAVAEASAVHSGEDNRAVTEIAVDEKHAFHFDSAGEVLGHTFVWGHCLSSPAKLRRRLAKAKAESTGARAVFA